MGENQQKKEDKFLTLQMKHKAFAAIGDNVLLASERDDEVEELSRAVAAARKKNDQTHDAKRRRVQARTKPRCQVRLDNVPVWFAPSLGAGLLAECRATVSVGLEATPDVEVMYRATGKENHFSSHFKWKR